MAKKPQNTAGNRNEDSAPQERKWPDKAIIRYIIRALVLLIVFAWALVNLDAVLRFLGTVLALFTPFLIGGAIAFLINVVLRPLECCWNKVCRRDPEKLTRPVCLSASTVLVLGILFAVVFMMIPSLRESGDEFIQNIPLYVEEIGRWWTGVVQFAAKYNIVLPEYAIDSDLLIEKVTALISDEGSGILTVTWGAATSVLSVLVDVLLGLVFALYLLAKKEVIAAHLKKTHCDSPSAKEGTAASEYCLSDQPNLYKFCQLTAYRSGHHRRSVLLWNADPWDSVCWCGLRVCGRYCAGTDFWRMDWRRSWRVFDPAGRTRQGSVVHSLSAHFAAGGGQSDLSQGGRQVRWASRTACADGCYNRRRSIRRLRDAVQRTRLCCVVQSLSGVHEESKCSALNDS